MQRRRLPWRRLLLVKNLRMAQGWRSAQDGQPALVVSFGLSESDPKPSSEPRIRRPRDGQHTCDDEPLREERQARSQSPCAASPRGPRGKRSAERLLFGNRRTSAATGGNARTRYPQSASEAPCIGRYYRRVTENHWLFCGCAAWQVTPWCAPNFTDLHSSVQRTSQALLLSFWGAGPDVVVPRSHSPTTSATQASSVRKRG